MPIRYRWGWWLKRSPRLWTSCHVVGSWWRRSPVLVRIIALDGFCSWCIQRQRSSRYRHNGWDMRDCCVTLASSAAKSVAHAVSLSIPFPSLCLFCSIHNEVRWQHVGHLWWGVIVFPLHSVSPLHYSRLLTGSSFARIYTVCQNKKLSCRRETARASCHWIFC